MAGNPNLSDVLRAFAAARSTSAAFTRGAAYTYLVGSMGSQKTRATNNSYDRIPEGLRDQICGRPEPNFVTRLSNSLFGYLPDSIKAGICPPPSQGHHVLSSLPAVIILYLLFLISVLVIARLLEGRQNNGQSDPNDRIIHDGGRVSWTPLFCGLFVARDLPEIVEPVIPTESDETSGPESVNAITIRHGDCLQHFWDSMPEGGLALLREHHALGKTCYELTVAYGNVCHQLAAAHENTRHQLAVANDTADADYQALSDVHDCLIQEYCRNGSLWSDVRNDLDTQWLRAYNGLFQDAKAKFLNAEAAQKGKASTLRHKLVMIKRERNKLNARWSRKYTGLCQEAKTESQDAEASHRDEASNLRHQLWMKQLEFINLTATHRVEERHRTNKEAEKRRRKATEVFKRAVDSRQNMAQIREEKLELQKLIAEARGFQKALKDAPVWQKAIEQSATRLSALASERYGPVTGTDLPMPKPRRGSTSGLAGNRQPQVPCTKECPGRMQTLDCENGLQRDYNRVLHGLVVQKQETIDELRDEIKDKDRTIERLNKRPKSEMEMQSERLWNAFSLAMN
ncbi:MAG: hypothetical protein M1831_000180 [Alyxoria varia]|nr:MAG: hypothetical protein M1831_000180 [Alyxoria varia]